MSENLLICGASARAAAFSALRAGYTPVTGDLFADEDLRARCRTERVTDYPAGLAAVARRWPGIPWIYTGGLENRPALVDEISRGRPLWGNAGAVLRRVRDPGQVASAAERAGLSVVPLAIDGRDVPPGEVWLSKPRDSCGGSGICVWSQTGNADCDEATAGDRYYQRRVEGVACGAVYVAAGGDAWLLGVTRQLVGQEWTGGGPFQYAGSVGPLRLSPRCEAQFHQLGTCLAHEFGLTGLFGADVILDGQTVWLLEVNPRYTASIEILERALGMPSIKMHVDACCEGRMPAPHRAARENPVCCGKAIVYAREDFKVGEHFVGRVASENTGLWPSYADIPAAGTQIRTGQPVLTVFADGDEEDRVEQRLRERVAVVRQWLSGRVV